MYCTARTVPLDTHAFTEFISIHYTDPMPQSIVLSLNLIGILVVHEYEKKYQILTKLFKFLPFTSDSKMRIMVYLNAVDSLNRVEGCTAYNPRCKNKMFYNQYKSMLSNILFSTKTDCASGWSYLASLFYNLKLYNRCKYIVRECLNKCTPDKIWMPMNLHASIPIYLKDLLHNKHFFSKIIQHYYLRTMNWNSTLILPTELKYLFEYKDAYLSIPPVVYVMFLEFLCDHQLKLNNAKKTTFRTLQKTVREKNFIVNDDQMAIAEKILNIANNIMQQTGRVV